MDDLIMITADGEAAAAHSGFRVLAVCLGILSVLLLASIAAIIYSEFHVDTLSNEQLHQLKSQSSSSTSVTVHVAIFTLYFLFAD